MANIFAREPKRTKEPTKEKTREKMIEELYEEKKEELEKKEFLSEKERIIREKLEEEVAKMKLSPELEEETTKKARQIKSLGEKEKLKHLLGLAEKKGVVFAVRVAKDMKDPYILDVFRDILAREGFYKKLQNNKRRHPDKIELSEED